MGLRPSAARTRSGRRVGPLAWLAVIGVAFVSTAGPLLISDPPSGKLSGPLPLPLVPMVTVVPGGTNLTLPAAASTSPPAPGGGASLTFINFSVSENSSLTGTLTFPAGIGFWISSQAAWFETECDIYALPCPPPAPNATGENGGSYSYGGWGRVTWVPNGSGSKEVVLDWSPVVLGALELNFSGPNNILSSGNWSIILANPWAQNEWATVDPAIQLANSTGPSTGYSVSFTATGLANGSRWSVNLSGTTPGATVGSSLAATQRSMAGSTISFWVSGGTYAYKATAAGYAVESGTVIVPSSNQGGSSGTVPDELTVAFHPGAGSTTTQSSLLGVPGAIWIGAVLLAIGSSGLAVTLHRYHFRENLRAQRLAKKLMSSEWELNEAGEPVPRSHR